MREIGIRGRRRKVKDRREWASEVRHALAITRVVAPYLNN